MKLFARLFLGVALLVYAQPAFAQSAALISGAPTAGHCAQFTGSHNGITDSGGACSGTLTNPAALGAVNLRSGSGAPSANDPIGSTYFRTDNGWTYQKLPDAPTIARVQEVASGSSYTVTLPAVPTSGNWLIANCHDFGTPSVGTGWTSVASHNDPNGYNTLIVYKKAGASETTTQTPCGNASTFWKSSAVIEVSGGVNWSDIYDGVSFGDSAGTTTATAARATTVGNSLAIGFMGWTLGSATGTLTLRGTDGWTNVAQNPSSATSASEAAIVTSQSVAASGTTVTMFTTNTASGGGFTNAVLILKPPTAGYFSWQKLSGLSKIQNAGATVESDPHSLNCSTGTTCTTDSQGNVTITASGTSAGANPTATASDVAVNGTATTYMRSDAAPAIQKGSASQFGVVKVDGTTITASGGVLTAATGGGGTVTVSGTPTTGNCVKFAGSTVITDAGATCGSGGGGTPVPLTIPDLAAWIETDQMLAASGALVPAFKDFGPFQWPFGATGSNASISATQLNSLNVVTFPNSSAGRYNRLGDIGPNLNKGTVFVVFKPTAIGATQTFFSGLTGSLQFRVNASGNLEFLKTFVTIIGASSGTLSASTWYQANATYDGSTGAYAFRIGRAASGSGTSAQSITAVTNAIGYNRAGGNEDLNGTLAEIIIYNRVLTSTEITTIETYLNGKWGV